MFTENAKMAPKCNNNTKQIRNFDEQSQFWPKNFFPKEKSHI